MATVFAALKYLVGGFVGLLAALFILALLFGKRVRKVWEYDADFLDNDGREIGEFDIELSRIEKDEQVDSLKGELRLRHSALQIGAQVEVWLDEIQVMAGNVESAGRVHLSTESLVTDTLHARAGQMCKVVSEGRELCSAELVPD